MRILSYNILDGGEDRIDAISSVIEADHPDVVCLVEADDSERVSKIAARLGMRFIHGLGKSHASAVFTKWTVRESINHAPILPAVTTSCLEVHIDDPAGGDWMIGAIHLHARSTNAEEEIRISEIQEILNAFAPHRSAGRRHILCGDFNTNAPTQLIDPEKCKPKTREAWQQNGGDLPRRVVQQILDAGYIDTFHAFDAGAANTTASFTTEWPGQRVDYIFAFGVEPRRVTSAGVVQSEEARNASDHFPVFATIDTAER